MLVSFLSLILSDAVFGMVVLISVYIVERGSTSSSVLFFHICHFACHSIVVFHDIPSSWHFTSLLFAISSFFLFIIHSFMLTSVSAMSMISMSHSILMTLFCSSLIFM